jgi:hypothetical protein
MGKSKQGVHTGNKLRESSNVEYLEQWRKKHSSEHRRDKPLEKSISLGSMVQKLVRSRMS